MGILSSVDQALANKVTIDVSDDYALVCELVEMENGGTQWDCSWVTVTEGLDIAVVGTGAGATVTRVYLMCYEHLDNGFPTGNTEIIQVM